MRPIFLHGLIDSLLAECIDAGTKHTPVTGIAALDEAIGGFLAVGQHILQAAPGEGKSALALQVACECECPALIITAEMLPTEIFRRLIARTTRTPLRDLKSVPRNTLHSLAIDTVTRLPHVAVLDSTQEYASPEVIRQSVSEVKNEAPGTGQLLIIDSLQVWARGMGMGLSEYDLINLAVRNSRDLALSLEAAILLISHRNRAGQQRGGLFASKGSGDVEYAAETVLELTTDDDARRSEAGGIPATLSVLKNRHGAAGTKIHLRFSGTFQSFREGR